MQGVERSHLDAAISAALTAFFDLINSTVEDALRKINTYGKKDTLGMDAGPEIIICQELGEYDRGAVVITEEVGSRGAQVTNDTFRPNDPQTFRTVFISDPTDRSNQLKEFLAGFPSETIIGKIFGEPSAIKKWEDKFSGPASITGATSAISCVRRGIPIFAVIINYVTREMMVSCPAGNKIVKLPEKRAAIDFDYVLKHGKTIIFPGIDEHRNMKMCVTFLGDVGKSGYTENFRDSGFLSREQMENETTIAEFIHYGKPGGPSRVLYLSALQPREKPIGLVIANGEKIGEWIHWLSFVQYARCQQDDSKPALVLYEVIQGRPWTKDGVLMSTPPNYSVFREYGGRLFVDTSWLLRMPNPSKLRSTLIVAPFDNRWVVRFSSQSGYRPIRF
jgi:hypothetical protein